MIFHSYYFITPTLTMCRYCTVVKHSHRCPNLPRPAAYLTCPTACLTTSNLPCRLPLASSTTAKTVDALPCLGPDEPHEDEVATSQCHESWHGLSSLCLVLGFIFKSAQEKVKKYYSNLRFMHHGKKKTPRTYPTTVHPPTYVESKSVTTHVRLSGDWSAGY